VGDRWLTISLERPFPELWPWIMGALLATVGAALALLSWVKRALLADEFPKRRVVTIQELQSGACKNSIVLIPSAMQLRDLEKAAATVPSTLLWPAAFDLAQPSERETRLSELEKAAAGRRRAG
jgi:hypothetical protein